jgi:hypothetical protein
MPFRSRACIMMYFCIHADNSQLVFTHNSNESVKVDVMVNDETKQAVHSKIFTWFVEILFWTWLLAAWLLHLFCLKILVTQLLLLILTSLQIDFLWKLTMLAEFVLHCGRRQKQRGWIDPYAGLSNSLEPTTEAQMIGWFIGTCFRQYRKILKCANTSNGKEITACKLFWNEYNSLFHIFDTDTMVF